MKTYIPSRPGKAFTLVELLVVIAIIAILGSLMLPALASSNGRVRRAMCANNLKELSLGAAIYAEHYDTRYPITQAGANAVNVVRGGFYTRWVFYNSDYPGLHLAKSWNAGLPVNSDSTGNSWRNFGMLYPENLAGDGSIFFCPGFAGRQSIMNASFHQPLLTTTTATVDSANPGSVRSSYIYNPWVDSSNMRLYTKSSQMAGRKVFGMDFNDPNAWNVDGTINPNARDFAHGREGGWNVMFVDGSVEFFRADIRVKQVYALGGGLNDAFDIQGICNLSRFIFEK